MKKAFLYNSLAVIIFVMSSLFFLGCNESSQTKKSKAIVSVSMFVLGDIVKNIAEETVELVNIIPTGVDIHSYEPTPKIMTKVEQSDLIFYNGSGLEPWIGSFSFQAKTVGLSNFVPLRALESDEASHDHHDHHGEHCTSSGYDPHIWFDINNMKRITDIITYELITLAPHNKDLYLKNRNDYMEMLERVHNAYSSKLGSCKLDVIMTDHDAFSYIAKNYNFQTETLSGFSPDAEISPKDVIKAIEKVKKHKVSVVFYESFSNDRAMKSIAEQTGTEIDFLHPLGNITKADKEKGNDYEAIMLQNLEKIAKALECQ